MPNKNYQRGRRFEWQLKKDLEVEGYHVMRTSGSHGAYDLIAIKDNLNKVVIRFIQCKVTKKATNVKALLAEIKQKTPVKSSIKDSLITVSIELAVKLMGEGSYTIYPVGA